MKFLLSVLLACANASFTWDVVAEGDLEMTDEKQIELADSIAAQGNKSFMVLDEEEDLLDDFDLMEPSGKETEFDITKINFDPLTDILLGKVVESEEDDTTTESTDSEESYERTEPVLEVSKVNGKRKRKSPSVRATGKRVASGSSSTRKRSKTEEELITTTPLPASPMSLVGAPEIVADDKPGRFVFRISPDHKSLKLVDTAEEVPQGTGKRVRFAAQNTVAFFV